MIFALQLGGRAQAPGADGSGDASLRQLLQAIGASIADNLRHSLQSADSNAGAACNVAAALLSRLAEAGGGAHRCILLTVRSAWVMRCFALSMLSCIYEQGCVQQTACCTVQLANQFRLVSYLLCGCVLGCMVKALWCHAAVASDVKACWFTAHESRLI